MRANFSAVHTAVARFLRYPTAEAATVSTHNRISTSTASTYVVKDVDADEVRDDEKDNDERPNAVAHDGQVEAEDEVHGQDAITRRSAFNRDGDDAHAHRKHRERRPAQHPSHPWRINQRSHG